MYFARDSSGPTSSLLPLAMVLSLALLAQSACTYHKTIPFLAEPGDVGKVVSATTTDGETYYIDRATVLNDTLYFFSGDDSGSAPVQDVESLTLKKFDVVGTILLVWVVAGSIAAYYWDFGLGTFGTTRASADQVIPPAEPRSIGKPNRPK